MDPEKYRKIFLEDATEHLADLGRGLLDLEKDPANGEALDLVFRMVHSLKGMSASLGYDGVSELSHRLEDRLGGYRAQGRVDPDGLPLLFRGLDSLERMVAVVRDTGEPPPPDAELVAELEAAPADGPEPEEGEPAAASGETAPGKARRPI